MTGLLARRRRKAEINIVPLIDVLTMLIFFFLVTMQFREMATLNLTLPRVETAGRSEFQSQVVVAIDRDHNVRVTILDREGRVVLDRIGATEAEIEAIAAELRHVDKDITVLIRSDEDAPLRLVTTVMDLCRKNGLNRIRLQTR
jgi:biopolymer transport protein ExbD